MERNLIGEMDMMKEGGAKSNFTDIARRYELYPHLEQPQHLLTLFGAYPPTIAPYPNLFLHIAPDRPIADDQGRRPRGDRRCN